MTREQLLKKFPNATSDFIRLNADTPVGGLDAGQHAQQTRALDRATPTKCRRKKRVAIVVTLIAHRHRLLDDDNLVAGFKPLRDAIARSLAIDDGSPDIRFVCGQLQTPGAEGTIVNIEAGA